MVENAICLTGNKAEWHFETADKVEKQGSSGETIKGSVFILNAKEKVYKGIFKKKGDDFDVTKSFH